MSITELTLNGANVPEDLRDAVDEVIKDKPAKGSLAKLRRGLRANPGLAKDMLDYSGIVRESITQSILPQPGAAAILAAQANDLADSMGYEYAPEMERLLIDQVVNSWLRLQYVENRMTDFMKGRYEIREVDFWERRLTQAQARHLKAIETLARVRKITRATLQVNIAEAGSQQLNVAGDLNR